MVTAKEKKSRDQDCAAVLLGSRTLGEGSVSKEAGHAFLLAAASVQSLQWAGEGKHLK